ncbi:hypothetical protein HanRHA438_Chr09g0394371 [Helianthus annuus]|uniref:Uncharacterized protein n=1 Tax=Helianthus annuus TaxID=4232 RepID=A0A9K3I5B3_HELAN|nr:hypothetical protein HanXRQr2_Chr09g0382761 [Helianthus annuus]KAJ0525617.1 hypothetical protein HanHA300_Chr09g0314111 [Helianthus annuus]KAJ0533806.1 hypothetical protein HanIR_Chr09g0412641 [Helianthus annuus]KAJ0542000.1 hypothetical protein HanHA89_Chr09g0334981 [Helianthus annuus]KAJ0707066.1 hypothetical protein HanLR1_Chr09g0314341 [Helianthus annuus]
MFDFRHKIITCLILCISDSVVMFSKAVAELDQIVMNLMNRSIRGSATYLLKPTKYLRPQGNEKMLGLNMGSGLKLIIHPHLLCSWQEAWTNGRIEAPTRRVMMTGDKDRSIRDHNIQVPQQLVDEDHPLQFRAFDIINSYISITLMKG